MVVPDRTSCIVPEGSLSFLDRLVRHDTFTTSLTNWRRSRTLRSGSGPKRRILTVFPDTHVAAIVYAGDPGLLSPAAVLELQYLHGVGRIAFGGQEIAGFLEAQFG